VSYENQTAFEDRWAHRRASSYFDWLLLLADDRSAFLPLGAGCTDWVCGVDRRVCHLVDHFIYRPYTIASITSCIESSADQAEQLTSRINCQ
jgi:hypothetical protein